MISLNTLRNTLSILILVFLLVEVSSAGSLPSNYPTEYSWISSIDYIDTDNNEIIIGDTQYTYSSGLSVIMLNSSNSSIRDLKTGMTVGVIAQDSTLISVWEFPDEFSGKSGSELDNLQ